MLYVTYFLVSVFIAFACYFIFKFYVGVMYDLNLKYRNKDETIPIKKLGKRGINENALMVYFTPVVFYVFGFLLYGIIQRLFADSLVLTLVRFVVVFMPINLFLIPYIGGLFRPTKALRRVFVNANSIAFSMLIFIMLIGAFSANIGLVAG